MSRLPNSHTDVYGWNQDYNIKCRRHYFFMLVSRMIELTFVCEAFISIWELAGLELLSDNCSLRQSFLYIKVVSHGSKTAFLK